jgi:hypothetical protein
MRSPTLALTCALLGLFPVVVAAQKTPPGQRLTVDIAVAAVAMRGDTTRVTYVLANRKSSVEQLFQFTVDAPSAVTWIQTPTPDEDWTTDRNFKRRPIAGWAVLGEQMAPGDASPPMAFEAVGLPGLVHAWVRGYAPPPPPPPPLPDSVLDTLPPAPVPDLLAMSLKTTTVGVSPFPGTLTPTVLVSRLDSLTARACGDLAWVASRVLCADLAGAVSATSTALDAGNTPAARVALHRYIASLDNSGLRAGSVKPADGRAYWLLRPNAGFILVRLPGG